VRQTLSKNNNNKKALSDEYLQAVAFLLKGLADENRLKIIRCLRNGKKSVSGIVEELNLSQPLVSHHLKELRRALLVTVERNGPFIYYETADSRIMNILKDLEGVTINLLTGRKTF
jgi:ArsR family transcriptional regulator, zinc-responsive transcriptional repressor